MTLNDLLSDARLAAAGIMGAIAAAPFHSEVRGWKAKTVFVVAGTASAFFLTDLVSDYFGIPTDKSGGVGFLLGAFSGSLIDAAIKAVNSVDVVAILKSRFGGNN